ncbi:ATP-binding protein [Streptomyces nigra]|uniref:ATP-binding protein n=1 Tax=Streptomyces nigra TaxID=1827580 RepID=UPI0036DFE8C6
MGIEQLIRRTGSSSCGPSVSGQEAVLRIAPAVAKSVPKLRAFAQSTGREWGADVESVDAMAIIVSELVANAYQHSGSADVAVLLLADRERVVVRVSDTGCWNEVPTSSRPQEEMTSGRGLHLVRAYASDLSVERGGYGTTITAEVSTVHVADLTR